MPRLIKKFSSLLKDKLLHRIFVGGFWNSIGLIITKFLVCGATVFFARYLTKTEFGKWSYLYGMLLTLLMFVDGPWSATVTKYVAEYRDQDKEKTGRLIALYLIFMLPLAFIIAVIAFCFSKQIAIAINHEELQNAITYFLLCLIPLGVISILKGVLNGLEEFKMCSLFFPLLSLSDVTIKCGGLLYRGFDGLIVATLLATCCQLAIGVIFCYKAMQKHGVHLVFSGCTALFNKLITFTLPNLFYIVLTCSGNMLVPSFFISARGGAETMATFGLMTQLQSILSFLPLMIAAPLLAILSNAFSENKDSAWKAFFRLTGILVGVLLFLGIVLILLADPVMGIFGKNYAKSADMLRLFVPAMICQILCPFFNQLFIALEKLWIMNFNRIVWLLVYVSCGWFLRDKGLIGIILAFLCSDLCWLTLHITAMVYLNRTSFCMKQNKYA